MEIIDVSITEYLRICKNVAHKRGFLWVMVLLARERDAIQSYQELKVHWDSFDDLTGNKILFIMSLANKKFESYNTYFTHEHIGYKKIYNPNFMVVNRTVPTIPSHDFPIRNHFWQHQEQAIDNNTHSISDICEEFNISEEDVPAILLFPTQEFESCSPIVIPIKHDNLYDLIKDFIAYIQPVLREHKNHVDYENELLIQLNNLDIQVHEHKFLKHEQRYLTAKNKLMEAVKFAKSAEEANLILQTIQAKDIKACKGFEQPIRRYLNQLIDLHRAYEDIEISIETKQLELNKICDKKSVLEKALAENEHQLNQIRSNLNDMARKYIIKVQTESKEKGHYMQNIPHFKIGITFSGKYRKQFVEPICNELVKLGYDKTDIFYDSWHDHLINGVHGDSMLRKIYNENCDFVIVLLSPDYKDKNWTGHIEWSAVKELINTGKDERICLLRVDNANIGELDGLFQNQAIAKTIDKITANDVAVFIDNKYKLLHE